MDSYQFPEQKVDCGGKPFSRELLGSLLEQVFSSSLPVTGYLKFVGADAAIYFLFFLKGAPYAAGKYSAGKPVSYTIRELGEHLAGSASESMTITLCHTDPVLLKSMLLFLQEEPTIKAPTTFIDLEYIVRQLGEAGANALITLCRDRKFNFFFFKGGKGAVVHYADTAFDRPEGMTMDEEMLLYAFQPGAKVEAYVFRDMNTSEAEDANQLDRDTLLDLLTGRKPPAAASPLKPLPVAERTETLTPQPKRMPSVVLTIESGSQQGERFTVTLPCTIGRRECDVILNDGQVSRRHAVLRVLEQKLVIEDLGSTNGTQVNAETVSLKQLATKDLITLGDTRLRVTAA